MGRAKQRADRLRAEVPILKVLEDYGYRVTSDWDREQQFQCDLHGDGLDNKPSARVYPDSHQWYCVDVGAPILTTTGWCRLGDVSTSTTVLDGCSTWYRPLAYLDRGTRSVMRVETSAGYEVVVTPDHEVFVLGKGWVEAQHLTLGDVVDVPRPTEIRFPAEGRLPFSVGELNDRTFHGHPQLNLPGDWSEELGVVMGYIFGDGWIVYRKEGGSHMVGLTAHAQDAEDARQVFAYLREWASGRGSERHRADTTSVLGKTYTQDQYTFTIGNSGLGDFFALLGMNKDAAASERRLPTSLWQAPQSALRGFLRGMYATDGSFVRPAGRTAVRVNLYSVSRRFLQDVQLILLQFGIHARVSNGTTRKSKLFNLQLATGADTLRFRDLIGVANTRKQAVLNSYTQPPNGKRVFQAKVSSLTPLGERPVADISMPEEHSFVAGGIRVHNCFACQRSRDVIQTVREKEGLDFWNAVKSLERKFNLPELPWAQDDKSEDEEEAENLTNNIQDMLFSQRSFEDERVRVETLLTSVTNDRELPQDTVLGFWEVFDRVCYGFEAEKWPDQKAKAGLLSLRTRVMERLASAAA